MNLQPFFDAPFAIQVHVVVAFAAFFLGIAVLWRRKGGNIHRISGRVWVGLMIVVSLSGLFIHEIRLWGNYSPIHILSVLVPIGMVHSILQARKGQIAEHQKSMKSTFVGGMVIAGGFTLLPGRMMNDILFGESSFDVFETAGSWLIPLIAAGLIATYFSMRRGNQKGNKS